MEIDYEEEFVKFPPVVYGVFAVILCTAGYCAAQNDELDREIIRLKKEISRVQAQRSDEAKQVKKEQAEFKAYQERIAGRIAAVNRQTDSINTALHQATHRNDSLHARISSVNAQLREQEMLGSRVRTVIAGALKKLQGELPNLPPLIKDQYSGPVSYLITELEAGTVENTEALYRMMRLVQDLRTVSQEIQVVEGASPVPQLQGVVYRLRIGAVFEAIVDQNGRKAFVWDGTGAGSDSVWRAVGSSDGAAAILKAVKIREGKTVPELVELPFPPPNPSLQEDGNEK
jgi:hypothetical protein